MGEGECFFLNGKTGLEGPGDCFTITGRPLRKGGGEYSKSTERTLRIAQKRDPVLQASSSPPTEVCTPRPPSHHRGTCHLGEHCERSRGSSEASERVPYTHSVRQGGMEQAAPCRRRRAPLKDAASTPQQSNRHPPRKLRKQRGTIDVQYSTSTREQEEGFAEPPSPSPPRLARTGDPHVVGSALSSLAATAGQGEHQAADLATTGSWLLGTLSKGVVVRGNPTEIHLGSGRRPPTTDCLVLCRSTRELSAPITSSQVRSLEPCQAHRPPQPARLGRTSAAAKLDQRDEALIEEHHRDGGTPSRRPPTPGAAPPTSTSSDLGRNPELPPGNTDKNVGETNLQLQDLLQHLPHRHLRPASPPEGLGVGPGSHGLL
jgi:hypothetical protein